MCEHVWIRIVIKTVIQLNETALSCALCMRLYRVRTWSFDRHERVKKIETETSIKSNVFQRSFSPSRLQFVPFIESVLWQNDQNFWIFSLFSKNEPFLFEMMEMSQKNVWKCPSKHHPHQNQWKLKNEMIFFHYLSDKIKGFTKSKYSNSTDFKSSPFQVHNSGPIGKMIGNGLILQHT